MDVDGFLEALRNDPSYADQIVHVHEEPARDGCFVDPATLDDPATVDLLARLGIEHLYAHQAEALGHVAACADLVVTTGTASGKTLCYALPLLRRLQEQPDATALLLYPTKALCQDQFKNFRGMLTRAGLDHILAGVLDGDTPSDLRRRLRDRGSVIFSNPDMVHAALMPQHARWAAFLSNLRLLVLDELHVYSGIFGTNMAHLLRRFARLCRHYGSHPRMVATSATIANPGELFAQLTGRTAHVIDRDGSPRGRRVYVFWNPPRLRETTWRSRRSANVEAHELMARLVASDVPTITFSKAKMTAEMIYRYVCDKLRETAPGQVARVTPYRGGYRPAERRAIEADLFSGRLLGVSTTRALELGIDVGGLEASIIVGYPGTLASFFQQAGRAGRKQGDAVVFLVGLDTSINQFIMSDPAYIFERCVEQAVVDPDNPFVATGHLRCATHEIPLADAELAPFGPHARLALDVLEANAKVRRIGDRWYHASAEIPQHEVSLRDASPGNVLIEDADSGEVLGQVDRFDAPPIVHPGAVYIHLGETYLVLNLDLERNLATVRRTDVDYYTQPLGGTDIHHIDHQLRERRFGPGSLFWGEVTAHCNTYAFEKVHFYSLDAMSTHGVDLPTMALETMAFWLVPPESLMRQVREAGLDAHSGLRAVGYATRMLLPLFMTCDTLDFSHTVGSVNSPWNAVFVFERYPHGLGFTEKAYERMQEILPAVLANIEQCPCDAGCPCCVGKPLRPYATWNVERGEASIPSKAAALMILRGMLADGQSLNTPDHDALSDAPEADRVRLARDLRRRLERMAEPQVFHPITPVSDIRTEYPRPEPEPEHADADPAKRAQRRRNFDRDLHKRIAKKLDPGGIEPMTGKPPVPPGMKTRHGNLTPKAFPGKPAVPMGDALAARARRRKQQRDDGVSGSE